MIKDAGGDSHGVVIACSALKKYYRDILRGKAKPRSTADNSTELTKESTLSSALPELPTYFVFITGTSDLLRKRMEVRPGHFMKVSMLDSQLTTLESPEGEEGVVVVSMEDKTEEQVKQAVEGLRTMGLPL